jgi:hypothetical protein
MVDGFDIPHPLFLLQHVLQPLAPALCTTADTSLSGEESRARRLFLSHMQHTRSQQRKFGTTIHTSFNELEPIDVPFERPLAPR